LDQVGTHLQYKRCIAHLTQRGWNKWKKLKKPVLKIAINGRVQFREAEKHDAEKNATGQNDAEKLVVKERHVVKEKLKRDIKS
jgi:hypothetical protein